MCSRQSEDRGFRLGDWLVQPSLGRISNPSGEVQLEPRVMDLLVFLAQNSGTVVSRRQILDAVWQREFVSDAAVSGTVKKLRQALRDDAREPRYIETLSKRGYRLLPGQLEALEPVAGPDGAVRVGDWLAEPGRRRQSRGGCSVASEHDSRLAAAVGFSEPGATISPFPAPRPRSERPVFVAREEELACLEGFLEQALAGDGRIAFVTGEAGTGKTALIEELGRRAQEAHPALVTAISLCSAQTGTGDAFAPWRQLLALLTGDVEAGVATGSTTTESNRRLRTAALVATQAVTECGRDLVDTLIPGAALLARAETATAAGAAWLPQLRELVRRKAALPPDAALQQAAVFTQATRVLAAVALRKPLLLVLEDLQWADAGSIALLFHLSRDLRGRSILILGSYRPTDVALGRGGAHHPLAAVVAELRSQHMQLAVELGQEGDRAFVDALVDSEPNRLGEGFRTSLFHQTAGHALFTVESLRTLQDRAMIVPDPEGRWVEGAGLDWATLPKRVEGILAARVERLDDELRELLTVASVEGEEFTAEVVAQVCNIDARATVRQLSRELATRHRLVRARGVRTTADRRLAVFGFSHVLFQRYLESTLDEVERARCHEDVAAALESLYGDHAEEVAVRLARHFEAAGMVSRAVHQRYLAGIRASRMTANQEALSHFTQALALLARLPEGDDRDRTELALQLAIQVPQMAVQGWGGGDVARSLERAQELADRVGSDTQKGWVLYLTGSLFSSNGRIPEIETVAGRLDALASTMGDEVFRLLARFLRGYCRTYTGSCAAARADFEAVLGQFDRDRHLWVSHATGMDHEVVGASHVAWLLARMGHLDQCLVWVERSLALAQQADHPLSSCMAPAMSFYCHFHRGEHDAAARFAEAALALATEHGLVPWVLWARAWLTMVRIARGQFESGVVRLQEQMDRLRQIGLEFGRIIHLCWLATGQLGCGRADAALVTLDEARELAEVRGDRFWEAEVHRCRAEALQATGATSAAEAGYLRAIAVAHGQEARLFELLAATGLATMWQGQGRRREARDLLAPVHGWFTEGLETPPLRAARKLLDDLGDCHHDR